MSYVTRSRDSFLVEDETVLGTDVSPDLMERYNAIQAQNLADFYGGWHHDCDPPEDHVLDYIGENRAYWLAEAKENNK